MLLSSLMGSIKSVQRGTIYTGPGYGSATISPVNLAKSELRLLGYSAGTWAYLLLVNTTTVSASSDGSYVSWELTEWN
jgi:hypothetical protein